MFGENAGPCLRKLGTGLLGGQTLGEVGARRAGARTQGQWAAASFSTQVCLAGFSGGGRLRAFSVERGGVGATTREPRPHLCKHICVK